MKSRTIQKLMCVATMLVVTPSLQAQSQDNQERKAMEQAQIHANVAASNAAVSAGDVEGALVTFEPGAVMLAQPGLPVMGTPALREAFRQFLAINPKITLTGQDTIQAGDIALHTFTWKMAANSPDDHPFEQARLSNIVLRKQQDGRWLTVIDNPFGDSLLQK
jgi:uncharacterized protein (TIGR02246 family)